MVIAALETRMADLRAELSRHLPEAERLCGEDAGEWDILDKARGLASDEEREAEQEGAEVEDDE